MSPVNNLVNYGPTKSGGQLDVACHGACEPEPFPSGTTWSEFVAKVGDLKMPGDGFADDLEAIQAAQGLAEMPEWPE